MKIMSVKRRDSKNRVLQTGESQLKDGRYMYKYIDNSGKTKYVYSWRLVGTDTVPKGKRADTPLREKIKQIKQDLSDGIVSDGGNVTVSELVKKYLSQKTGVRPNTISGYNAVVRLIENDNIGSKRIDKIKLSDAKEWFIRLQHSGHGYSHICMIKSVVGPAFKVAVEDDLIRKNPFDFSLSTVIENDVKKRQAISQEAQASFLEFLKKDKRFGRYYEGIYILFNTGLRISEFAGLTFDDIDLDNRIITVDHQLQKLIDTSYAVIRPKTKNGIRRIPMTEGVKHCFEEIKKKRKVPKVEPEIDGMKGFLYLDKFEQPMILRQWDRVFKYARKKYNETNEKELPNITPHICRHTFCSNMAKAGMNPKALQKIMGHAKISTTLDVYTHIGFEDIQKEMNAVFDRLQ